jgi:glycosyltransferase involved in cell wall biosynthesis
MVDAAIIMVENAHKKLEEVRSKEPEVEDEQSGVRTQKSEGQRIDVIIEAARRLQHDNRLITFVLCGTGDNLEEYKRRTHDCRNIIFPGWVGEADIWTLLRKSSVGLAPYKKSFTLSRNLTNKPIEYMSAGLPIISSLEGVLEELLHTHKCGITYAHGDVDSLVRILLELYDNRVRLHVMARNAYALFKEKYVAEKVFAEMTAHIEQICQMYPASRRLPG